MILEKDKNDRILSLQNCPTLCLRKQATIFQFSAMEDVVTHTVNTQAYKLTDCIIHNLIDSLTILKRPQKLPACADLIFRAWRR